MSPRRSKHPVGVIVVVALLVYGLGVSCNGFREDEIECEQAVVRLNECCPGFRGSEIDCSYRETIDCDDKVTARSYPAISMSDSKCIQGKACADLVAKGDCTRAQAAKRVTVDAKYGSSTPNATKVCE